MMILPALLIGAQKRQEEERRLLGVYDLISGKVSPYGQLEIPTPCSSQAHAHAAMRHVLFL